MPYAGLGYSGSTAGGDPNKLAILNTARGQALGLGTETSNASAAPGGAPYNYDPTYGGIPNLPATLTDTTSQTGTDIQAQMIKNLPNYQAMLGQDTSNIQSNLAGQLSPDVITQLQQQAAERGTMTGTPYSANSNAAYLRALGLNSLQLQQLGNTQLTAAMNRTPIQQTQQGSQTTDLAALRALYGAAPIPANAALANINALKAGLGGGYGAANPQSPLQLLSQSGRDSLSSYERNLDAQLAQLYGRTSLASPKGQEQFPTAGAPAGSDWMYDPSTGWIDTRTGAVDMSMYGGGGGGSVPNYSPDPHIQSNYGTPWQQVGSGYLNPQTQNVEFYDPRMGEPAYSNAMYQALYGEPMSSLPQGTTYDLPSDSFTPSWDYSNLYDYYNTEGQ